jgi:hypothetical protein
LIKFWRGLHEKSSFSCLRCLHAGANVACAAAPKVTANVPLSVFVMIHQKLSGMGYLSSMPTGAKPYSRLDMAKWTLEAKKLAATKPMRPILLRISNNLKKNWHRNC